MIEYMVLIKILLLFPGESKVEPILLPPIFQAFKNDEECQIKSSKIITELLEKDFTGTGAQAKIYIQCNTIKDVQS